MDLKVSHKFTEIRNLVLAVKHRAALNRMKVVILLIPNKLLLILQRRTRKLRYLLNLWCKRSSVLRSIP